MDERGDAAHAKETIILVHGTWAAPVNGCQYWYQHDRDRSLADVQADSKQVFGRLLEVVELHSEEFLIQPQQFEGVPNPMLVWKMLEGDGYEHYRDHMRSIRAWLEQSAAHQ